MSKPELMPIEGNKEDEAGASVQISWNLAEFVGSFCFTVTVE